MGKPRLKYAPFTSEEVERLQRWQKCSYTHSYTCCNHVDMEVSHMGLYCPECGRTQNWVVESTILPSTGQVLDRMEKNQEQFAKLMRMHYEYLESRGNKSAEQKKGGE